MLCVILIPIQFKQPTVTFAFSTTVWYIQVQNSSCVTPSLPGTQPLTRELSNYVLNTIFPAMSYFCRLLIVSPYFRDSFWICHIGQSLNLYRSLDIYSNPQGLLPCQRRKSDWFDMICSLKSILTISYHIITLYLPIACLLFVLMLLYKLNLDL